MTRTPRMSHYDPATGWVTATPETARAILRQYDAADALPGGKDLPEPGIPWHLTIHATTEREASGIIRAFHPEYDPESVEPARRHRDDTQDRWSFTQWATGCRSCDDPAATGPCAEHIS